ncbi:tetratricopeptide repeat protein [Galbibacter sp. BG1]|uniref:tetratricopeptide repeat protein n=1 Tax=Galbibacter sp. BG1 TaxID=1170699 RepID=UPI0015B849E5|nr:tetratricopeptide repeat protein [Galbibacter sp. BG1]QLE01167.1 tetratricopeptide repeat protein [Galbibacter sp. BG1]
MPQEIPSETDADISHEENNDAFQEYFYESLKQKGIENYDRAIKALLECKLLQPNNEVIDYELGLNYMYQKKYVEAQPYLETAVEEDPQNKWYLDALLDCFKAQQDLEKAIAIANKLLEANPQYYNLLTDLYMEQGSYDEAVKVLNIMETKGLDKAFVVQKKQQIAMMQNFQSIAEDAQDKFDDDSSLNDPIEDYRKQIEKQQERTDYSEMLVVSSEALDNYPTQPTFYYLKGVALNKLQKFKMASEVLEEGLIYLLNDKTLEKNIYKELVKAYNGINNADKAKEYQQKIDSNNP